MPVTVAKPLTAVLPGVDLERCPFRTVPVGSLNVHSPEVSPSQLQGALGHLVTQRERALAPLSLDELITRIERWATAWRDPRFSWRAIAVEWVAQTSGFSRQTLSDGLDAVFAAVHRRSLEALIRSELGEPPLCPEGPTLTVHWLAGAIPAVGVMSLARGLLSKSAQLLKPSSQEPLFAPLLAASWQEIDPALAGCVGALWWPGGQSDLEEIVIAHAGVVVAYGDDQTLLGLRKRIPASTHFVGYGHRWSLAIIGREQLTPMEAQRLATQLSDDITLYDQLGCLSPQVVCVERDGQVTPEAFAHRIAETLVEREKERPAGRWGVETLAAIRGVRDAYDMRRLAGEPTQMLGSPNDFAWTVLFDPTLQSEPHPLPRVIRVIAVEQLETSLRWLERWRGQLSTVGVAVSDRRFKALAGQFRTLGVERLCPIGQMQRPTMAARHILSLQTIADHGIIPP